MYLNYKFLFSLSIIIIIIINTINCNNSNVHNEHKCHEYLAKHTLNSKIIIKAKPYLKLKPTANSAQSAPSTTIKYSKHLIQQQQQQLQHQQQQESSILFHIEYIYLNNQTLTGLNLITIGASSRPPPLAPTIQSPIHKSNNRKPLVQQAQHQHQQYSTILIQNFGLTTTTKITTQNNTIKASTTTTTNNQCELNNNNINGEIDFTKSYILFIDKNNLTTEFYNLIKLNANKPIRERVPKLELIQIKNSNSFIQHNEYNENTIKSFICDNCVKKPYVYDMPETTYATINNMLQITCKYNGNPIPKIIWRKENNVLHSNNYLNNQTRRFHIITKNNYSTLNIYKVTNEDRGTYHCIAHDYINNNDIIKSTKVVILTQQQQQLQSRKPFVTSTTLFKLPTPTTPSPKTTILNTNRRLSSTIKPINNNNNNNNNKNIKNNNNNNNNNKNNIIDYANFEPCGNSQLYIKCFHGGTCYKSKYNRKGDANFNEFCICKHLYSGKQCEIDMGFLLDTNYKYKNRDSVPNEFKNLYDKLINNNNNKDKTKGTVING